MNLKEKIEISKLIIQYALEKYRRLFVACSFGKDSRVLVDLAMQTKPRIPFIGIDTGYEFAETLDFADSLVQEIGMNFRWVHPPESERRRIEADYGEAFIKDNKYKCCEMKVPAIGTVLGNYDAWITALRRDETEHRKNTSLVEMGSLVKINPIAFWTKEEVWQYIREKRLRYHPLYDRGYASLGCRPCTGAAPLADMPRGASERLGRFAGTSNQGQECGLHQ